MIEEFVRNGWAAPATRSARDISRRNQSSGRDAISDPIAAEPPWLELSSSGPQNTYFRSSVRRRAKKRLPDHRTFSFLIDLLMYQCSSRKYLLTWTNFVNNSLLACFFFRWRKEEEKERSPWWTKSRITGHFPTLSCFPFLRFFHRWVIVALGRGHELRSVFLWALMT